MVKVWSLSHINSLNMFKDEIRICTPEENFVFENDWENDKSLKFLTEIFVNGIGGLALLSKNRSYEVVPFILKKTNLNKIYWLTVHITNKGCVTAIIYETTSFRFAKEFEKVDIDEDQSNLFTKLGTDQKKIGVFTLISKKYWEPKIEGKDRGTFWNITQWKAFVTKLSSFMTDEEMEDLPIRALTFLTAYM